MPQTLLPVYPSDAKPINDISQMKDMKTTEHQHPADQRGSVVWFLLCRLAGWLMHRVVRL